MAEEATGGQRSSMFRFKGKPPPSQQSASAVAGFVRLLSKHCEKMAVRISTHVCIYIHKYDDDVWWYAENKHKTNSVSSFQVIESTMLLEL